MLSYSVVVTRLWVRNLHKSLLAIRRVVVEHFTVKSLFEMCFDGTSFFFFRDDDKVVCACVTNKIRGRSKFIDYFPDQHGSESEYIIDSLHAIYTLKWFKIVDTRVEQGQAWLMDDAA